MWRWKKPANSLKMVSVKKRTSFQSESCVSVQVVSQDVAAYAPAERVKGPAKIAWGVMKLSVFDGLLCCEDPFWKVGFCYRFSWKGLFEQLVRVVTQGGRLVKLYRPRTKGGKVKLHIWTPWVFPLMGHDWWWPDHFSRNCFFTDSGVLFFQFSFTIIQGEDQVVKPPLSTLGLLLQSRNQKLQRKELVHRVIDQHLKFMLFSLCWLAYLYMFQPARGPLSSNEQWCHQSFDPPTLMLQLLEPI